MNPNEKNYVFFYSSRNPFSNFYPCTFYYNKRKYNCVEQFFQYSKAGNNSSPARINPSVIKVVLVWFCDKNTARQIMLTNDPKIQKQLGRSVKNFTELIWEDDREDFMKMGLREKVTKQQNFREDSKQNPF